MLPVIDQYEIAIELLRAVLLTQIESLSKEIDTDAIVESLSKLPDIIEKILSNCADGKFSFVGDLGPGTINGKRPTVQIEVTVQVRGG